MEIFWTTLNKFLNLRVSEYQSDTNLFFSYWTRFEEIPKSLIRGSRSPLSIPAFSLTDRLNRSEEKFSVSGITEKEFLRYRGRRDAQVYERALRIRPPLSLSYTISSMLLYKLNAVTKRWIGVSLKMASWDLSRERCCCPG